MSRPKKTPRKRSPMLIGNNSKFIDPLCCHSRVSYSVAYSKWNALTMAILLSDCDRQVKWEFRQESTTDPLLKLDAAIAMLKEARGAWITGMEYFTKQNRGRKTRWIRPTNEQIRAMAARVLTNAST